MTSLRLHGSRNALYLIAAAISLILSLSINLRESVINPDAICYLLSAEMLSVGVKSAMHLCGQAMWPFYSMLIYGFAKVSHLSYQTAAYVLDAAFTLVSVLTFMKIVAELGGKGRVLIFAAAVILLHHDFNSVRQYIIRDHGFWAFYLLSLLALLKFSTHASWRYAFLFSISLVVAALFRIEGAVFLLLLPWLMFFKQGPFALRTRHFFMLQTIPLLLIAFIAVWLLVKPQLAMAHVGRLPELAMQVQNAFSLIAGRFNEAKLGMAQHVLTYDSIPEAGRLLSLLLIIWYCSLILGSLSFAFTIVILYGVLARAIKLTSSAKLVMIGYLLINLVITSIFFLEHFFLSKRYLLAFSLTLLLFAPFALNHLYLRTQTRSARLLFAVFCLAIVTSALGGIFDFGYSKSYIHDAGNWVNTELPKKATLYANDIQLMYYTQKFGNSIFEKERLYGNLTALNDKRYQQYDYLALRLSKKNGPETDALLAKIPKQMVKQFQNKRGDRVVIYKVVHEAQ